jgi:hypothetical protein
VRSEPGRQHPAGDQYPLGDHQTLSRREIGPAIDAVEVAEVVDPRVSWISDVDDAGAVHAARLR